MRNCTAFFPLVMSFLFNVKCSPISQPGYENPQYVAAQNLPAVSYKPQQIHFKPAAQQANRPVYEGRADGLQYYSSQPKSPSSIQAPGSGPVRQVFVPTNQGPRQVDPSIYDQLLKAQQQATLRRPAAQQQQAYQPQQLKYAQPQAQPQYSAKYQQPSHLQQRIAQQQRLQQQQEKEEEEEEEGENDPNPSYQFGFDVKDDQFTNYQTRKEEKDGKKITGSYSVVDSDGYIRTVKYTADPIEGFKAEVSREPTDIKIKIPKPIPQFQSHPRQHQPQQQQQQQQYEQQTRQRPQYVQVAQQRIPQRAADEENGLYRYQ